MKWKKTCTFSHKRIVIRATVVEDVEVFHFRYEQRNSPVRPWGRERDEYIVASDPSSAVDHEDGIHELVAQFKARKQD